MNDENRKKSAMIRAILCILVIIVVILGWTGIIPRIIGMVASSVILCGISAWNGIEALKEKRKSTAIFNFIMMAVIMILCIGAFVL